MEINKYREDYPFFKNNPDIIFFDNYIIKLNGVQYKTQKMNF